MDTKNTVHGLNGMVYGEERWGENEELGDNAEQNRDGTSFSQTYLREQQVGFSDEPRDHYNFTDFLE